LVKFLLSILKLILAVLLLPVVFSVTRSFLIELKTIDPDLSYFFLCGVIVYLAAHLLLFKFSAVFHKGQQVLQAVFGFLPGLAKIIGYINPIYAVILLVVYLVAGLFWDVGAYLSIFLILSGFLVALHFICTAEDLKAKTDDLLKANYIFCLLLIWVFLLIFTAAIFHLAKSGFYFNEFFNTAYEIAHNLYLKFGNQLIVKLR
jgi:hypothetical protein